MSAGWRGEGCQDQGRRPYQEDSWALRTLPDGAVLAIVADGMGGHAGGAVASKLVVETFVHAVETGHALGDALQAANAAVKAGAAGKAELRGMGSTLVAALAKGDAVRWVSVGDSPFYLVAGEGLERLNADHSFAPQIDAMVERGLITTEEAARHPGRHALREAVMGEPLQMIDEGSRALAPEVTLLLCSDGVESLAHPEIAAAGAQSARRLLDAVLAVGNPHQDNVTILKLDRSP